MKTETTNLFIKETYVNDSEGYRFGSSDWFETFTDDVKTLFRSLQKEYGKASKMYIDSDKGSKQTGWVFSKQMKYEDTKDKYTRSVWVTVSKTEPKKECRALNVTSPF